MGGWRSKLIFLLVVYFAGFATAIYCLAPVPENYANQTTANQATEKSLVSSALKSDEFAQSFNTGMHRCLDFAKTAAWRAGEFLRQKYNDRQLQTDG